TNLGVARSKTDDKDGAIVAFKKAIELKPTDAQSHFNLATVYRRQRKTDEAIHEYETATALDSSLASAQYDLGILYSQQKRHEEALAAFRKYLAASGADDAKSRHDAEERIKTLEAASGGKK